ncbi:DUF6348 family protein [Actinosynnema sp. NPDC059797]
MQPIGLDRDHLVHALAQRLNALAGSWSPVAGGVLLDEGPSVVVVTDLHDGTEHPNHIDVGFAPNPQHPDKLVLWDCAVGHGRTPAEVAEAAAAMWLAGTGKAVLELLTQEGEFATHLPSTTPEGLAGHHVIHGPVVPMGGHGVPLVQWVLANPLVPALREALPAHLDQPLNGVKVLFGGAGPGEHAEVRVNGGLVDTPTAALRALPWPRLPNAYAHTYLLVFAEQG